MIAIHRRYDAGVRTMLCAVVIAIVAGCSASREPGAATSRTVALSIANRALSTPDLVAGTPAGTIRTVQGERLTLEASSDERVSLHLHGYEKRLEIGPRESASLAFDAMATGRFPLEGHYPDGTEKTLVYLEVHPR